VLLDGYIRVSQVGGREGERFISPSVQREQIVSWVRAHQAQMGEVFEELDQSGARSDRPLLSEAIKRVERGESGGVIVAKLDRFGRTVVDGLRSIQRIEDAGGTFVSVQDGLDLGTPTGRLMLQVLFSIGEWELERVRANWETARKRAVARGVYIGNDPIGYRKEADGRLRIDSREAALIREIFRSRADGKGCPEIARLLNGQGARTRLGCQFRSSTVAKIINNPAYRGEAHHGVYRNQRAHEPIVDPALWQQCQHTPHTRKSRYHALLGGRIRCGSCGRLMSTDPLEETGSRFHVYSCTVPRVCPAPAYARGDELDPLVEEFLFRHCHWAPKDIEQEILRSESVVKAVEEDLASYRDEPSILATLGASSFAEGLSARQRRLEKGLVRLASARQAQSSPIDAAALAEGWPRLDGEGRRIALRRSIDCVIVERGTAPVIERAWIYRPGRGPIVRIHDKLVISADSIASDGERLREHRQWSAAVLEKEMRGFLAGRSEWPTYREFADSGRARLFAQVLDHGGPYYWGHRFGLRVPHRCVRWNPERVRAALHPFLENRVDWPGARAFAEAGMAPVYRAVQQHGGISFWAAQFGLRQGKALRPGWPEERIVKALGEFTEGRRDFPRKSEFLEAGLRPLYSALSKRGGVGYWARRLELVQQRPGPRRRSATGAGRRAKAPSPRPKPASDPREHCGAQALLQILHPAAS
jgi:DNA invertase Pin-like site-specific DNA recombinase